VRRATSRRPALAALAAAAMLGLGGCGGPRPAAHPAPVPPAPGPAHPAETPVRIARVEGVFAVPRSRASGSPEVTWRRETFTLSGGALALREVAAHASARDSLAAWNAALRDPVLADWALHRLAPFRLAHGDTAGADSAWRALASRPTLWTWEAVRARLALTLARGDTSRADSLLAAADRKDWTDAERAGWLAMRAGLQLARRDTASAVDLARQTMRRFPALPAASAALAVLERALAARRESLTIGDMRAATDVEILRGDRTAAAARLEALLARPEVPERWSLALRLGEVLRLARRFPPAHEALARGERMAPDAAARARVRLERARVFRDGGESERGRTWYARAAAITPDATIRATAWWESGREAEDAGLWPQALAAYARVAAEGGRRRPDAWFRAGLMALVLGRRDSALAMWSRSDEEEARFWRAVVIRREAGADTAANARAERTLRALAERPGYSFYGVAARETLGLAAPRVETRVDEAGFDDPALRLAARLAALGQGDDAGLVLDRWAAGDARAGAAGAPAGARTSDAMVTAARIAYAAGRPRLAIRYAERAIAALPEAAVRERAAIAPWIYPPAYDSLFAAAAAAPGAPERTLLQAVAWQESRFDVRARSRTAAMGLFQLMRPAIADVAASLREPVPSDSVMLEPGPSLRYGALYLARQLQRFPGNLPLALAAYNAGSRVAARWTRLRAVGGDALACEEIAYPETQDYVKSILAARQAYRELQTR